MKGYICQQGLIVNERELKTRFGAKYNAFLNKLTLYYRPKVGPPKRVVLYKLTGGNLVLPRSLCYVLGGGELGAVGVHAATARILDIEVALPPITIIPAQPLEIELYDNQKIIVDYLMTVFTPDRIAAGTACALLNLRAGFGKTFVAAGIIAALKLRTLYIVPKRPLMVQAVKDLEVCFAGLKIGQFGTAKKNDPSKHDVTVIVIDSALLRDLEFFAGYSCVVFDEVHSYCSDKRKKIFKMAGSHVMLGMSATTEDRKDGFDAIAHKELAIGGVMHADTLPGFEYADIKFDTKVTVIRYNGPPEYTKSLTHESTGMQFTPYMNKQFLSDPHRNELALRSLRDLYDWTGPEGQKHCIYVFCEEVAPLGILYNAFHESFGDDVVAPECDVAKFVGGIKDAQITAYKRDARILLSTYGYAGTGVSIDKMTAILFLTPRRANMKQILARILRGGGDRTITRRVIDIVDNKTSVKYQLGDRMCGYRYYEMDVDTVKVTAPTE
jgi:hypothetical protein